MDESILTSIKKMLGIVQEYTEFDSVVIIHINSVLSILNQLGVGPSEGLIIKDDKTTWSSLINDDNTLESVKSYVYVKTKILFDPPNSSIVMDAMNRTINELECRINIAVETKKKGGSE